MAIEMLSKGDKNLPPVGIEPTTPGLRDQCSASELQRHLSLRVYIQIYCTMQLIFQHVFDYYWSR